MPSSTTSPENSAAPDLTLVSSSDTIVAVASPQGKGGITIVRLSGPDVPRIANVITNIPLVPRSVSHVNFVGEDDFVIDSGIALLFNSPNSYTGEDVLELQGHGSPVVMQMLIRRCLQLGCRLARPGEFSERAFLNGRLDLTQAEAVADLIDSSTESAAKSAIKSLQGGFSKKVTELVESVTQLRIFVEAAIDFPDEEIDFLEDANVVSQMKVLSKKFSDIRSSVKQGKLLRDGLKVVLTGLPNAGKSSLLNAVLNEERAIVSTIPGTTRDILEQTIEIDGLAIELIDTAGIRDTTDEIEEKGVQRAKNAQHIADVIILVIDDSTTQQDDVDSLLKDISTNATIIVVRNKIDLTEKVPDETDNTVWVSALNGDGLSLLTEKIKTVAGFRQIDDSQFIARQRHIDALQRAEKFLNDGLEQQFKFRAGELLADDLASCQKALGEITGETNSDELLGLIFGSFCIGK